jgi:hypothetical protein
MPSATKAQLDSTVVFWPILGLTLILWIFYRSVFHFPVWFDETIGKALFFGLPVWLYITITQDRKIAETFSWEKFEPGILLGLAFGGLYGFATSLFFVWAGGGVVQPAQLFLAPGFWNEFLLAMSTAFWETLLFFSFVQTIIRQRYSRWSMSSQVLLVTTIFVAFHVPNAILRADALAVAWQVLLLALFAIGQALIFYRLKNSYVLVLSQAFWGLVLLVHGTM